MKKGTEEDYNIFLQFKNNKEIIIPRMLLKHRYYIEKIRADISGLSQRMETENTKMISFLKWINQQTEFNFYIIDIRSDGGLVLIKRNLEAMLSIAHRTIPSNQKMKDIIGVQQAFLEIKNIYSSKKGEGYKIMQKLIKLANKMNYPIILYTESESNIKYFERYGFINHGKQGDNSEYLMILMP